MTKTPEELASEYAKITASDIPGVERVIGENPCLKKAFLAGYHVAQDEILSKGLQNYISNKVNDAWCSAMQLGQQAQWRSIKDQLPEIGSYVLVTHRTSQDYTNLKVMVARRINDDEYEICDGHSILADYVNYWMPLTSVPVESK